MNTWFRMYSEFADDPKVQMMPEHMQRRLVMLFCERCKGGTLHETERAFHWRVSLTELAETKALFLEKGFIEDDWTVTNWNKRQFISDSSTSRVRRFRSGRKQDETFHETHETQSETVPEQNRTDSDTEQTKEKEPPEATPLDPKLRRTDAGTSNGATPRFNPLSVKLPGWLDYDAWEGFVEMRKKIKKPLVTSRAVNGIISELGRLRQAGNDPVACIDKSIQNNYPGVYPANNGGANGSQGNRTSNYGPRSKTAGNFDEANAALIALVGQEPHSDGDGATGDCIEGHFDFVRQ